MIEDVAGTQSAGTQQRYATCSECGQLFRSDRTEEPASLADNGYSELAEVCPNCDAMIRQGEMIPRSEDDY